MTASRYRGIYWLSTPTMLRACTTIANAVAIGNAGDLIHRNREDGSSGPAAHATHRIYVTKAGRKIALKIA